MLLEIVGGGFDRLCSYDEVVYQQKAFQTMPHLLSNEPMVVIRANSVDESDS